MDTYRSGYINHRNRKIPLIWDGQHAQHIAEEHIKDSTTHPLLHVRIQQLAKKVKEWENPNRKSKRYKGFVTDNETNQRYLVVVEILRNFAFVITCYTK
jgi:hypothetical protein